MEISPFVLAKMLFVAFLFSIQTGIIFDFGRALCSYFSCSPKNKRIKAFYNAKVFSSKQSLQITSKKRINRFFENAIIFFFDVFLVIYSAVGLVKINFSYNDGVFRFFTVLAFILGFLIYYFVISKMILLLFELLIFIIKYLFVTLFGILERPFSMIYNKLVKIIKKKYEKFHLYIEKKHKVVYNVNEILCNHEDIKKNKVRVRVRSQKDHIGRIQKK